MANSATQANHKNSTSSITLSSIQFHDPVLHPTSTSSIYASLKSLRVSTLSLPNRLRSIIHDSVFVQSVSERYGMPLIANERCGSWYIPPAKKKGSAYFKSTDGHWGSWGFSLRRLNLGVLDALERENERNGGGGVVIVDSTRRGKRFPDALTKTVPIWCAVVNRVCFGEEEGNGGEWARIQWPRGVIGEEEANRIEERLPQMVGEFKKIGIDLRGRVNKPLKCFWITQGEGGEEMIINEEIKLEEIGKEYYAILLCSASRRVEGAEMSEGGYIQGAGDDAEAWAKGLIPEVFWHNQKALLETPEDELEDLIEDLLEVHSGKSDKRGVLIRPTENLFLGSRATTHDQADGFNLVISCHGVTTVEDSSATTKILDLNCKDDASGKLGSRDLRLKLKQVKDFVSYNFEKDPTQKLLITCNTGNNLSVGVALAVLCLFYNDEGQLIPAGIGVNIDKTFIRRRLAWITESKAEANPSRSTLQAVNFFLFE